MDGIFLMRKLSPDVAILPVKSGERPLSGLAGNVDWVTGGFLSRLIKKGRVQELDGEVLMYSNREKFPFPLVFAFFRDGDSLRGTIKRVIENLGAKKVFLDFSVIPFLEISVGDIEIIKYVNMV